MIWVLLGVQLLILLLLWDTRRRLKPRALSPRLLRASGLLGAKREWFQGAVPPDRFVVIRWPDGLKLYGGHVGAMARDVYANNHPGEGQEIEFWELGECRGRK